LRFKTFIQKLTWEFGSFVIPAVIVMKVETSPAFYVLSFRAADHRLIGYDAERNILTEHI